MRIGDRLHHTRASSPSPASAVWSAPTRRRCRARRAGRILIEVPSSRMSTSIPVSSRNQRCDFGIDPLDHVHLTDVTVRPESVCDCEARGVVGQRDVVVAEARAGPRHLLDRRAAVRPVAVHVQVALEGRPQLLPALGRTLAGRCLQPAQVDRASDQRATSVTVRAMTSPTLVSSASDAAATPFTAARPSSKPRSSPPPRGKPVPDTWARVLAPEKPMRLEIGYRGVAHGRDNFSVVEIAEQNHGARYRGRGNPASPPSGTRV